VLQIRIKYGYGDGSHTEWEHGLISSIEPRTLLMRGSLETL